MDTDFILLRCRAPDAGKLADSAERLCAHSHWPMGLHRAAWSASHQLAYIYLRLVQRSQVTANQVADLIARWAVLLPEATDTDGSRLLQVLDVPGQARGQPTPSHYVVETDPEAGWDDEIGRWYDTEHMPGLAAVPGCIHARRFINQDAGPRSLACYDLVSESTLGSPLWLAVRATEWSSRTRPHFTNTRRTMLQVIA